MHSNKINVVYFSAVQCTVIYSNASSLHCTTQYFTGLYYTILHCIVLHNSSLHYTALYYIYCTAQSTLHQVIYLDSHAAREDNPKCSLDSVTPKFV